MDHAVHAIVAAIGSFFVVSILLAGAILLCQRRNSTKTRTRGSHTRTRPVPTRDASLPFSITVINSWSSDPNLIKMSWEELARATDNFSPHLIVGDGSFGLVYKARLSTGVVVAVKKLSPDAFQGFCEFTAEMETLSRLRHPNIVKILGYWSFGPEHKCCEIVDYAVDVAEVVTVKCLLQSSAFEHSKLGVLLVLLWWLLYVLLFISEPGRGLRVHVLTHQVGCFFMGIPAQQALRVVECGTLTVHPYDEGWQFGSTLLQRLREIRENLKGNDEKNVKSKYTCEHIYTISKIK